MNKASGPLKLDDIRNLAQELKSRTIFETYLHGSGQKSELALAPIFANYASLYSPAVIASIRQKLAQANDSEEKRKLAYLLADCLESLLDNEVALLRDALATQEANKIIQFFDEKLFFHEAALRIAGEPSRQLREAISQATRQAVVEFDHLYRRKLETTRQFIREKLNFVSYAAFYESLRGFSFQALAKFAMQFLEQTAVLYQQTMAEWTKSELGLALAECERHDIAYLMRTPEIAEAFPEDHLIVTLESTLTNLGLDLRHVTCDLEKRPKKSPRAFCAPVRIPAEVYLVVSPDGGANGYSALFHEAGHALHFSHCAPDLSYEFRYLGDYSVTEAFAFTFEHLLLEEGWLSNHTGLTTKQISDYRQHAYRQLLFMVRRYAAKLCYELQLHDEREIAGKEKLYVESLQKALMIRHYPEYWLYDTDGGFYSAYYLRAWILAAQLRAFLRRNFGEHYFHNLAAGRALRDLWQMGQRFSAQEIARQIGFDDMDSQLLADEIANVLQP
ncbi:MAG: hypothetical protein HY692_00155 [Cyanobacteria bacterium NC_groundwater_1444_Ag_S-0.65um_54_12]|nr:hypothetical protein [Cyanobacteria bacterium NC_groundwater_1444_Ag_S-0.65um_54_12]